LLLFSLPLFKIPKILFFLVLRFSVFRSIFLRALAKNSSFGFFGLGFRVGKKPKVLFVRLVSLLTTSLYMARSVQIKQLVSDEARAEFLNFSYFLFLLISQIYKFGGLANMP